MNYKIKNVTNETELDKVLEFNRNVFNLSPETEISADYTREAWISRIENYGEWMLYTEADEEVIGIVFGRVGGENSVTVGPVATDIRFRKQGIAAALMAELEKRVFSRGYHYLALGSAENAEGFYLKCGFTASLLIQDKHPVTLDDLRGLNTGYNEAWCYDDGTDVRLCLLTNGIDRALQHLYDRTFPGCSTQTLMGKHI